MQKLLLGGLALLLTACAAQLPPATGPSEAAVLGYGSESDNPYDMGPPIRAGERPTLPASHETTIVPPLGDRATGLMPMPEDTPPEQPQPPLEPPAPAAPAAPAEGGETPAPPAAEGEAPVAPAVEETAPALEVEPVEPVEPIADERVTVPARGPCCSPFDFCSLFNRCDPCNPCRRWYVTGSVEGMPGIGGGMLVGREIARAGILPGCVSAEIGYSYQTLYSEIDEEYGGGGIWQLRGGLKVDFVQRRSGSLVPFARFGMSFMEVSGDPGVINNFGDWFDIPRQGPYLGAYGSLGVDWQFNRQFSWASRACGPGVRTWITASPAPTCSRSA